MKKSPLVSVVVPVRNEKSNLETFFLKLHKSMQRSKLDYEVIAVDDYSQDDSLAKLQQLSQFYPINIISKTGPIGKGHALYQGLKAAQAPFLAYIDADNAYDPEYISDMLAELETADVIVAGRQYNDNHRRIKRFFAQSFQKLFGRMLFGLDVDVQAGLKVFKREVFESLDLHPGAWSFDLEFLFKASHAGFVIGEFKIDYHQRATGKGSLNLFSAGIELLLMSLKFRLSPLKPVQITSYEEPSSQIGYKEHRFDLHTKLPPSQVAIQTVTAKQIAFISILAAGLIGIFYLNWHRALVVTIGMISLLYFIDLIFNLYLIINTLRHDKSIKISHDEVDQYNTKKWPMYTILCPLYKEWQIVPQFVQAISKLKYPHSKLDVMLILEADDTDTINQVKHMDLPSYMRVVVVPDGQPKTKPKACNYALNLARGKYAVIYDAEDVPDPLQLKKAVIAFEQLKHKNVVCLQAKLNYYNPRQNLLTRLFTAEYSLWFDLILTGLVSINAPIPLGGTSNHFKLDHLKLLQGWDPFNVTEDCDLGMRLFKYGYTTAILDSTTWEEANSDLGNWIRQRSRWIKGYIQTYLVHMRSPHEFISDWRQPHLITFHLIVGSKVLSLLLNPILWLTTLSYFLLNQLTGDFISSLYYGWIYYLGVFSLVFGNFMYLYYYMIGCAKRQQWDLIKYAFFIPAYWLMMSIASWKAFYQIIFKPHYWEKTIHGLHLESSSNQEIFAHQIKA